jgi:hypothetical protein
MTSTTADPVTKATSSRDVRDAARMEKLLAGFKYKSPPWLSNLLTTLSPALKACHSFLLFAGPYLIQAYLVAYKIYEKLPKNVVTMILGLAFCFFGGFFAVTFAAVEAFKEIGGDDVWSAIDSLKRDVRAVLIASKKDDDEDKDGNGIKDVHKLTAQELVTRKVSLALKTVNPEQINTAVAGLYKGFTGVVVVLKFRFARTIALALSIAEYMRPLAMRFLAPALAMAIPAEYHQWISTIISVFCRTIATSIAWKIQRLISTIQAGIKGGLMFSRALVRFLHENEIIDFDDEATFMDEILGWVVAAMGIWFQIEHGWHLPFILNIFLWPLHIAEHVLIWSVTWMDTPMNPDSY